MAGVLLESTVLHDLVRGESAAVEKLDEQIEERTDVAVSTLTVFEVGIGLRGDAEQYRERYQATPEEISTRPFSAREARNAVRIQHQLLDRGERIDAFDVLVAGTARSHGTSVLTRNVDEFERVGDSPSRRTDSVGRAISRRTQNSPSPACS